MIPCKTIPESCNGCYLTTPHSLEYPDQDVYCTFITKLYKICPCRKCLLKPVCNTPCPEYDAIVDPLIKESEAYESM
jgi:hypothetical protein